MIVALLRARPGRAALVRLGYVAIRFAPDTYELVPFADGELVSNVTAKLATIE